MAKIERIRHLTASYFSKYPSYLILFVTSRCNAQCKMCFNWQNQDRSNKDKELTIDEVNKISKGFKNLLQLTIGGGEPFLRDDIAGIVKCFYDNSKARLITISTNGFFTDKIEKAVRRILQECPGCLMNVGLSLDCIGSGHDRIRGLNGSFEHLVETYKKLCDIKRNHRNFYLKISTVLSKYNAEDIEEVFDYVKKNFIIDDHELLLARGNTREPDAKDVALARYKELLEKADLRAKQNLKHRKYQFSRLFYALYKHTGKAIVKSIEQKKAVYPCLSGKKMVVIYDNGVVSPCELLPVIKPEINANFGNIREFEYDIKKVLNNPQAKTIKSYIRKSRCFCSFECAGITNIVFNARSYPSLLKEMVFV